MSSILSHFQITSLHHLNTVTVEIDDDKLILVGENGTGKSTVVNLIYFFLTRQWDRMLDYKFHSIKATIHSKDYDISREELAENFERFSLKLRRSNKFYRRIPRSVMRDVDAHMMRRDRTGKETSRDYILYLAEKFDLPVSMLLEYYHERSEIADEYSLLGNKLSEIDKEISQSGIEQVLYLPTYRRIEQDLHLIVPGIEKQARRMRDRYMENDPTYIELVEFGMEDVERTIKSTMADIKDNVRNGLNALTGTYLRDVIRGEYRSNDLLPKLKELGEATINSIFNRIPTTVLSVDEQDRLREIIIKIREKDAIAEKDKVIAHFLTQLIELHSQQTDDEKNIQEFVNVCNKYLIGKQIAYDSQDFDISIYQDAINKSQEIEMRMLSSGEKQIISLFSHIYLSGGSGYYVIIDEPELSLSVPWQKQFLTDILDSGRCSGLIAVTHSPFIYDNKLDSFAHSLEEFTSLA